VVSEATSAKASNRSTVVVAVALEVSAPEVASTVKVSVAGNWAALRGVTSTEKGAELPAATGPTVAGPLAGKVEE
jgi:hypothetical protein